MNMNLIENNDKMLEKRTPSISLLHQALADNRINDVKKLSQDLIGYYKLIGAPQCLIDYVKRCADKKPTRTDLEALITVNEETLNNIFSVIGTNSAFYIQNLYQNIPNLTIGLSTPKTADTTFPTELLLTTSWIEWIDGWFSSTNEIVFRSKFIQSELSEIQRISFYQILAVKGSATLQPLASNAVIASESRFSIQLLNPWLPLICAAYSRSNELIKVAILPFPSLLRKGFHYAELCAVRPEMQTPNAISSYSQELLNRLHDTTLFRPKQLLIVGNEITGHEYLMRPNVSEWLVENWGFMIYHSFKDFNSSHENLTLCIACDGLPTLTALCGLRINHKQNNLSSFLVVSNYDYKPLYLVSPGSGAYNENSSEQNIEAHTYSKLLAFDARSVKTIGTEDLIAIHITQEITDKRYPLLVPTTADQIIREKLDEEPSQVSFSINLYGLSDLEDLRASLWSVALQEGISIESVNIFTDNFHSQLDLLELAEGVDNSFLVSRIKIFPNKVNPFIGTLDDTAEVLLVMMQAGICLHQPTTLSYLANLLRPNNVSSTSCMLVHEQRFGKSMRQTYSSCGLFPETLTLGRLGSLELSQADILGIFGLCDFSVIANTPHFSVWKSSALKAPLSTNSEFVDTEQGLINASLSSFLSGQSHIVTSRISASYRIAPSANKRFRVCQAQVQNLLNNWSNLASRATFLQRLES